MSSSLEERRARAFRRSERERARADRMPPPWSRTRLQRITWPLMPAEVVVILLVVLVPIGLALLLER